MLNFLTNLIGTANAQQLEVTVDPCPAWGLIPCKPDLARYVFDLIEVGLFPAFFGLFFAMVVFYGFRLAIESRTDKSVQEAFTSIVQAATGAVLVSGAYLLANVFAGPALPTEAQITEEIGVGFLGKGIAFFIQFIGFILMGNIVIQGIRLIVSLEKGHTDTARKNLILSFIGAVMVMLAQPVLSAVTPGAFNNEINSNIVGIANFLATIFGVGAVLAFIVAGIMLVVSVNENVKDRAKTLMFTSVVAIIVVISSLALVTVLLPT